MKSRATTSRVVLWVGITVLLLGALSSDWNYSSDSGLKLWWPWESCEHTVDPDRVDNCAMRACIDTLRSQLRIADAARIQPQVSHGSIEKQQTTHLFRIGSENNTDEKSQWASCVTTGVQVLRAGIVSAEEANQIGYGLGGSGDL